ncbi:MAG: RNA polymerase sigma factor [Myxococcota bacterium]
MGGSENGTNVVSLVGALTDAEVVVAAQRGDRHALRVLYERHAPTFQRVVRRIIGESESADALQESFAAIFRNIRRLRDPERFAAWAMTIVVNTARAQLRRRRARRWLSFPGDSEVPELPVSTPLDPREALRRCLRLLDRLPTDERIAFSLAHLEGMELADAAGAMGISLATYKRRLRRARERMEVLAQQDPSLRAFVTPGRDADPERSLVGSP